MKRVLQLSYRLSLAGTEMVIMNWFRNIDRSKLCFDFAVTTDKDLYFQPEIEHLGGKIYKLNKPAGFLGRIKFCCELYKLLKTQGPFEDFHTHAHYSAGIDCFVAFLAGVKKRFVISHYDAGVGPMQNTSFYKKLVARFFIKCFATKCFAVSFEAGKTLFGNMPFIILKNGIDLDNFTYNEQLRSAKRKELGIENNFAVGHIGRFAEQKNHTFLIDIFAEVYKRDNTAILLLAGKGPLEPEIKTKVKKTGLENAVKFLGSVSDSVSLYNAMDCFVFPSLFEGVGIVAIEAQATGLPCVISSVCPQTAFIVNCIKTDLEKSPALWAEEILKTKNISGRKGMKQALSQAGYDIKQVAKTIEKEYL